jgi:hypothetical protein
MHFTRKGLWAALLLAGASGAAGQESDPANLQWRQALWPTGTPVSLFDLVEQGYEVRTYQPGLERSWLYVQKGRKLFRCDTPEQDGTPALCEELVKPY